MYLYSILNGLIFFLPIRALYFEKHLFTVTNVAIIFAVQSVALVIFELPTGAIADLFGRKKTLILAKISVLLGIVLLYFGRDMGMFIIFAIFISFGRSLASGTENALIYDTLKEQDKQRYYKRVIGKFYALWPMGAALGSIIGGYLANVSLSLPVALTAIPVIATLTVVLFIKEPEYEKENHRNMLRHIVETSKIVISNKQLIFIFSGVFVFYAFLEVGLSIPVLRSVA